MANDSDALVVGGNGGVYVAPVGTALPTDVATALPATFLGLGYITEDGASFSLDKTTEPIKAWQTFYEIRRIVQDVSAALSFTLLQWDANTVPLAFGGGTITTTGVAPNEVHRYDPPEPEVIDERALVLEWLDGTDKFRIIVPRVMVSEGLETNFTRTATSDLPITMAVLGTDGVKPWSMLSNAAEFGAA